MNETYKSKTLDNREFILTSDNLVKLECGNCSGNGRLVAFKHNADGVCFKCDGLGFTTVTMGTIKKWEIDRVAKDKENAELQRAFAYKVTVQEVSPETLIAYKLSKVVVLNNGLQEVTGTVTNRYFAETSYGSQEKLVVDVNGNTLWVNVTKALEDVDKEDTITIELEVNMFNVDERKGSGKAGRRKLINHIKG
jgi:hypothetical protein